MTLTPHKSLQVNKVGPAPEVQDVFVQSHQAILPMKCRWITVMLPSAAVAVVVFSLTAASFVAAQSNKPQMRNCNPTKTAEWQQMMELSKKAGELSDEYTACMVGAKGIVSEPGKCKAISDQIAVLRRNASAQQSKAYEWASACHKSDQDGFTNWQANRNKPNLPTAQGCDSVPKPDLRDPDQAALNSLIHDATDLGLVALLNKVARGSGVPIVFAKNMVKAYKTTASKNALAHIRHAYNDGGNKIVVLSLQPPGSRNGQVFDREQWQQFLGTVGGTVWTEKAKIKEDGTVKGVFWHPDPNFTPKNHTGRLTMEAPECTGDRPFGNQDTKPVIRSR